MVLAAAAPVKKISPHRVLAKSFHSGSPRSPVAVLLTSSLMRPPPLKKCLAAAALANVTVLVNVMVQVAPDVAAVFELVPVQAVYWVPLATALFLLVVMLVKSVFNAARTSIKLPVVGADLAVIEVPV